MMLALTAKEVRSLGKALTFRAVREQGAGLYLIRGRSRDGEEREGERQKKRKEGEHEVGRRGGGGGVGAWERLQLWCAWGRETVNDRAREFKRHGVCWLAGWTEGEREVCDSRAWQVRQNKPVVTHGLLHSLLWSDPAGQPTIWDGTTYSSNHLDCIQDQRRTRRRRRRCVCVCTCVRWGEGAWRFLECDKQTGEEVRRTRLLQGNAVNLLKAQCFLSKWRGASVAGSKKMLHDASSVCVKL